MSCPICGGIEHDLLLKMDCGAFDQSKLYKDLTVLSCKKCGHIYNGISIDQYNNLIEYYKNEYSISNIQSPNKNGDIPGNENKTTIDRYEKLFKSISPYIKASDKVLDIGCAAGGFLKYLRNIDFKSLYGVDVADEYTKLARLRDGIIIKDGFAENLPFSEIFDFIISDQVLEHLYDPNKLFIEAKRLLKEDGYLCISVPDSQYYLENHFFDYYWFLLREHIQHYDTFHLTQLAALHGFTPENFTYEKIPMISDKILLSILTITFRNNTKAETVIKYDEQLKDKMIQYFRKCNDCLEHKRESINKITTPILAFGASRELLYLYNNTNLRQRLSFIIDDIPFKQKYTLDNIKVYPSNIISTLPKESNILITAFAHEKILSEKIANLKYAGKIINIMETK